MLVAIALANKMVRVIWAVLGPDPQITIRPAASENAALKVHTEDRTRSTSHGRKPSCITGGNKKFLNRAIDARATLLRRAQAGLYSARPPDRQSMPHVGEADDRRVAN